ncbi:MAG: immunoglobulin domain-containing protein, partial [Planctomycetota bacterium]
TFNSTTTVTNGTVSIPSGTVNFNSPTFGAGSVLTQTGGTTNFAGPTPLETVNFSGTTWTGVGDTTVSGFFTWTAGTMSGSGRTICNGGMSLSGGDNKFLSARTLEIGGTAPAVWTSGYIYVNEAAAIEINPGAAFDIRTDAGYNISRNAGNRGTITNHGTFRKSVTNTATSVDPVFNNNGGVLDAGTGVLSLDAGLTNFAGTILTGGTYIVTATLRFLNANIVTNAATIVLNGAASAITNLPGTNALANFAVNGLNGDFTITNGRNLTTPAGFSTAGDVTIGTGSTLTVTGTYTQTSGSTALDGGTLDPNNLFDLQSGTLVGSGTVAGNLTSGGTVMPGLSPGILNVTGDYTQSFNGSLEIEKGGLNPGSGFDRLNVTGTASLAGRLAVSLIGGFEPEVGTIFDVVTAGSVVGTFSETDLPLLFGGNCKGEPQYSATAVTLTTYARSVFRQQPASQNICEGDPVTFSVEVGGSGPFIYEWRKDGVTIPGETASSLTIDPVDVGDAGQYDVVVTNVCGSETSTAATLTVHTAPVVTEHPESLIICEGDAAAFSVQATGFPSPTFQWRKGGVAIPGETASTLTIDPVEVGDAGQYDVVVTNVCGSETSAAATLTVYTAPAVTDDPDSLIVCAGDLAAFFVQATGYPSPAFQWRKGGVDLPGETAASLTIDPVEVGDAGQYDVVVTNVCGSEISAAAELTVLEPGPGDYERDCDLDLKDYAGWVSCSTGPDGGPYPAECATLDFDEDDDVDLQDFAAFAILLSRG